MYGTIYVPRPSAKDSMQAYAIYGIGTHAQSMEWRKGEGITVTTEKTCNTPRAIVRGNSH